MFFSNSKSEEDPDMKGTDYVVVTIVCWRFLCFVWTQKTIKGFRKIKEGEQLNLNF